MGKQAAVAVSDAAFGGADTAASAEHHALRADHPGLRRDRPHLLMAREGCGRHLALAAPAKSSEDFEKRAASGEFDQAPVTFRDANGQPAALRPDIEELRRQAAELKRNGPVHKQPSHRVEIFKPDEKDKAVVAEDQEPEPQTVRDHPRAYYVDKLSPPRQPPPYSRDERNVGEGREGIGRGPDPEKIGPHVGFRVPQR